MITAAELMQIAVDEMAEMAEEAAAQKEKERQKEAAARRSLWQSVWTLLGKTGDVLSSLEVAETGRSYDELYTDSVLPTESGIRMLCRTTIVPSKDKAAPDRIRLAWSCYVAPDLAGRMYRTHTTSNILVKTGDPIPGNLLREFWAASAEILRAAATELENRRAEYRGTLASDLEAYASGEKHAPRVSHSNYMGTPWDSCIDRYMLVLGDEVKVDFAALQALRDSNVRSLAACEHLIVAAGKAAQAHCDRLIQVNRNILDNEPTIPGVWGETDFYRIRYAVGEEVCADLAVGRGENPVTFIVPEEGGNVTRQYLAAISVEKGKARTAAVFGLRSSREFIREADTGVHFHPLASAEQRKAALAALHSRLFPLPDSKWELAWALHEAEIVVDDDIFLDVVGRLQHYYSMGDSADES